MRIALVVVLSLPLFAIAQYTETINTNNPGRSQGAFSVGTNVVQFEGSAFYRSEEHDILRYERDFTGLAFQIRYGFLVEELELSYFGTFNSVDETINRGFGSVDNSFSNFSRSTIGAKYLVFDPIKKWGEREINIYSYKDNRRIKWRDLIPAVSVYVGANFDLSERNSLLPPGDPSISPRFELITQNNWGPWALVLNFIADRATTDFPSYGGIATMTHSINRRWAAFGEFQTLISDFYSDDIGRAGVAYLINQDWQVDASGAVNFKDTPSFYQVNVGMSYRLDFHKDPAPKQ
ncbi:transporter [Nonlabens ponticola]|uniref:Transporter n=1 Tax=Nonlabens ponticola TaxID=2496866 RepID=A0A3S9N1D6_9FLAO|nr:transporter [Nonlabens ponticola]AZQ45208.1 transporter [Nonlabens ponticola]